MKKNIFAICDLEPSYLGNLADYISRRGNLPFELHAFTTREALLAFARENPVELLLISPEAYTQALLGMEIGKIVLLSEGDIPDSIQKGEFCEVYKYQSCAGILKETMTAYGEAQVLPVPMALAKKLSRVYGVYSPAGGCGCTSFALCLGMELARRMPTLYLSLEGCSGLPRLLGFAQEQSLGDLLYLARQRDPVLVHRAGGMVMTVEGLDILPPVILAEDIHQTEEGDLEFLLSQMSLSSAYEGFVIDLGREAGQMTSLMGLCDRIYVPQRSDVICLAKMEEFLQSLLAAGEETLLSKLETVTPPTVHLPVGAAFASALLWGEMGDAVRALLKKEEA